MFIDYLENIVQLVAIIIALLISVTSYISSKQKAWLCAVGFFTSTLLSCYFWTAYLVIIGDSPNTSDLLTNFGWNTSYFIMLVLVFYVKTKPERRYFHLLMLLPIPLNIWQLILYLDFDGIFNSIYQVTVCTAVACISIQGLMYYIKNRKNGARKPYIEAAALFGVCTEFGMWTSTCFDGWVYDLYYPCSFLCSFYYLLIVWAIRKTCSGESAADEAYTDKHAQRLLKGIYVALMLIGSMGGVLLGCWLRDTLTELVPEMPEEAEASVYDILPPILFLASVVLAVFAIVMIFIVYFEQKISENHRLREATQVAERSNAAKSDFLANMSHEIRTPINAVLGMNRMIMRESIKARDKLPADRESVKQTFSDITGYAANIDSAGNSLLSIINDILDFSKIEAGKLDIVEKEYMLNSVLNDVSNTVMFRAKEKGLEYHIDADTDIPDVLYGDEVRIRQIIINVLNNAVKYTDKGSVTLSVFGGGKQRYENGGTVELILAVKDTGIGIKKEDIDKIFGKFERTDLEHNSTVEGTGLGLAITHHLLEMMHGSISVESEYGKGSIFTVRLPQKIVSTEPIGNFREKFEKRVIQAQVSDDMFRAPDAHILIVDDTRMNLTVAVGLLKDTEIDVDTAESGAEALEMALKNSYDVILMDQRMPGMDGTETLIRFREQEKGKPVRTPVICLTADAISGAKERYISEGFDDYLSKPIDIRDLKKLLMQYLPAEKVIIVSDDDAKEQPEPETDEAADGTDTLYKALAKAGINTANGLIFCQNDGLYRTMLQEYVNTAPERKQSMQQYFDEQDWKNYATVVHALKSTSKTIGADDVAEIAAKLEAAAKSGDTDTVLGSHDTLLKKFGTAVSAISAASSSSEEDYEVMEFIPEF